MIRKTHSPIDGHTRVIFELPASLWADRISVVGNFHQGQPHRTALHQERDGHWRAALDLPVGHQYHFYYVVDGERRTEFQAGGGLLGERESLTSLLDLA